MIRTSIVCALVSTLIVACNAQPIQLLIHSTKIDGILDSIAHRSAVQSVDGEKRWTAKFSYMNELEISQIQYLSDGLKINGYIVQPKAEGKYPCIIFNRGGNRDYGAVGLRKSVAMLGKIAKEGYVVIASNYRGGGGSEGEDEVGGKDINDVLNLIPLLAEFDKADTSRIGMFGGSRGGVMTYRALTMTNKIKAAAVLGAPTDKFEGLKDRPSMENLYFDLVEGYEQNRDAELTKRSAIKWVDKFPKDVPILIMHGNSDWRVKSTQSLRLSLELDEHRVPYRLIVFEGGDHGLSQFRDEYFSYLADWFNRYVKEQGSLPDMNFHGD